MKNNLLNIDFGGQSKEPVHVCEAKRNGDWIIYRCPHCPDYERRFNWRTRAMKTQISQDNHILHSCSYSPEEYEDRFLKETEF